MNSMPTIINKLNFLIHPGYCSAPDLEDDGLRDLKAGELILPCYTKFAKGLGSDELMLLYTHASMPELRVAIDQRMKYALTICELRKILGRRLFVMCENGIDLDLNEDHVNNMIQARGFHFDPETVESIGAGETLGVCVEDWSHNLNHKLGLRKKTRINTAITNAGNHRDWNRDYFMEHILPELQGDYDRLEWF